ncbi:RecX family transcriptional regulator [Oceanotoga sp. DSM 15011]|jgi:regulatory protein|uniref:Regulatory protein RecX n=1 Tax=Oceanotoga teriensis TaxID=515440 RepID=A0AA45C7L2_9BACT|nr:MULTISPECIES: RecX family transcriptional regulator [Oceanotoga]MDO7976205.1 RecX family transcriptional regulator [Oceanotoga teriensis]PWJ95402.1 regulatory protein [Oceanotoga teriensis]UYP01041.1 RecX family transcriptional regulator [Oceanotoga sp. DSM 15011]
MKNKKIDPDDPAAVEKAAASLLKYRMRSEHELKFRLKMKGYSEQNIENLIKKLKKHNIINDNMFAYYYSYDKITLSEKGPKYVFIELKKLGVDESIIYTTLEKIKEEVDIYEIAKNVSSKYYQKTKDILKTKNYLFRRGFETDTIEFVIRDLGGD